MRPKQPTLAIVGAGRVGSALASALAEAGWPPHRIAGHGPAPARSLARRLGSTAAGSPVAAAQSCDAVLLAVPLGALPDLASELAGDGERWPGRTVLHTSGSAPVDALGPLRNVGAAVGRLHPLLPFTGRRADADRLRGAVFGVDGDRRAVMLARQIARTLGGRPVVLPEGAEGPYHLSAVVASNLLVALAATAAELGPGWGLSRPQALRALLPLLRATLDDLEAEDLPRALTGPVSRGEAAAIQRQLRWLGRHDDPDLEAAYRALSRVAVRLAREDGRLDQAAADRLRSLLSDAGPAAALTGESGPRE